MAVITDYNLIEKYSLTQELKGGNHVTYFYMVSLSIVPHTIKNHARLKETSSTNCPNPFYPITTICLSLEQESDFSVVYISFT
ncbi:MAG: hypothetical protein JXR56_07220 [Candidatus Cloacimonetes bacterium]|nr:hypothetical protein [Candidatus Cloacimonadota bacterium]